MNIRKFLKDNRGQQGVAAFVGVLVLIIIVAISQVVVDNVLNVANINTGLWTLLPTLWPVVAIMLLISVIAGAALFFASRR